MKLAVVGSRGFRDYKLLSDEISSRSPSKVISGGANGADKLAAKFARSNDIELIEFLPQFKLYKHPYHHRNRLIAEECDSLLAFWDGQSTGTKYTIEYAKKIGKPVEIIKYG